MRFAFHRLILAVWCAAVVAAFSATTQAFGDAGHRVIGRLAELHLRDTRALAEVRRILRSGETLADAAVWPDRIKDSLYIDDDSEIFRLNHPGHETYHYANVPFQTERYALDVTGARPLDIVQMSRECIDVLRNRSALFTRREALRLLAHFIGDLHQPLHVGSAFVAPRPPLAFVVPQGPTGWRTTQGGNLLVYGPENRFNLHSYWDVHVVNLAMAGESVAAFAARLVMERPARGSWDSSADVGLWPAQWASEGLAHAKDAHHGITLKTHLGPDETRKSTPHRWLIEQPADYDKRSVPVVRNQLALAGFRLAATLRAIWGD